MVESERRRKMRILGMDSFLLSCRQALVRWYNENMPEKIGINDTFVVWSCKTLQNYKCLCSTNVDGDNIYVEYTHNGDKQETYQDIYFKKSNIVLK